MSDRLFIKAQKLEKHLNDWIRCKDETVKELNELAANLDKDFQRICEVKVVGSTTSIVGGILTTVGFGLSFGTFGASLGLTLAGSVIAGAGGITVGGSMIKDARISQLQRETAQAILNKYNELVETIFKECIEIGEILKHKADNTEIFQHYIDFFGKVIFGAGTTTKCVTWDIIVKTIWTSVRITASYTDDAIVAGVRAGASVFRSIGSTAGKGLHIAGGVVGILVLPLDMCNLVDSVVDILNKNPHEVSTKIREWADHIEKTKLSQMEIKEMMDKTFHH